MHSPIDVLAGCAIGTSLLLGWCNFDEYLDAFITSGENGRSNVSSSYGNYDALLHAIAFQTL